MSDEAKAPFGPESDPADYTVEEVNEYLATAEADEVERVLLAESEGKARTTIQGPGPNEDESTDDASDEPAAPVDTRDSGQKAVDARSTPAGAYEKPEEASSTPRSARRTSSTSPELAHDMRQKPRTGRSRDMAKPEIDTQLPRETGSEKSGAECPSCGTELPVVETAYRSQVTGACPNCTAGEQLEAQKAAATDAAASVPAQVEAEEGPDGG